MCQQRIHSRRTRASNNCPATGENPAHQAVAPGARCPVQQTILAIRSDLALVQVGQQGVALVAHSRLVDELDAAVLQPLSS